MRKAAFHNLGCKVNSYETEAMQQLLEDAGYEIVPFREGADVYIINTCSVTNVADRKSRQMLHRAKKMNPSAAVVAVGCYVQAAGAELKKDEAVDLIVGNNQKKDLVQILDDYFADHENSGEILDIGHSQEYEELHIRRIADHTRAFIKVQDGCNQFCSYCIIPYTRGRVRSRRPEDIEREVRGIAEAGYREIVLTGIHLSSYGVDFKDEQKENLLTLIKRLDQIPGIERLRLGSLEPRIVTREFAKELASLRTICPHFHLSLQSGCNETLKRIHFYEMHIFKYSRRAGTRAADMPDQVPEGTKSVRSDILLALEKQQSLEYRGRFLGTEEEILLEEPIEIDGTKYMMGHTRQCVKGAVPYEEGLKNKTVKGIFTKALNEEVLLLENE